MSYEEQLQRLEKMRANGDLTEGEFLARKHKLETEGEKKSPLNPVFTSSNLSPPRKKKGGKMMVLLIIIVVAAAAGYFFFMK